MIINITHTSCTVLQNKIKKNALILNLNWIWSEYPLLLGEVNWPPDCYLPATSWPGLIQQSASPQLLFLGLTHNNRGGWESGGGRELLWAGLGTAQNRCPGSNPISPQTSKSSEVVSGRSAVSCSECSLLLTVNLASRSSPDPLPCCFSCLQQSYLHLQNIYMLLNK